jgi:hypothetical protein
MIPFVFVLTVCSLASAAVIQMDWNSQIPQISDDLKALQSGMPIVVWVSFSLRESVALIVSHLFSCRLAWHW